MDMAQEERIVPKLKGAVVHILQDFSREETELLSIRSSSL